MPFIHQKYMYIFRAPKHQVLDQLPVLFNPFLAIFDLFYFYLLNYINKSMRQDLRERQRQIRKLHESIQKYQQSPSSKKAFQKASYELAQAIQYKFKKSETNRTFVFPRSQHFQDEYDLEPEIVDLRAQPDNTISHQLSIAQQPESNNVYISQKTVLQQQKYSPFSKQKPQCRSKLKIKVIKKKNLEVLQTSTKVNRLKTQNIATNYSTINYKSDIYQTTKHNSSISKSRLIQPVVDQSLKKMFSKIKVTGRLQTDGGCSPNHCQTLKTQYSNKKKKEGKENIKNRVNPADKFPGQKQKHYFTHQSSKKIETFGYKMSTKCSGSKCRDEKYNQSSITYVQIEKKSKFSHRSYENLKSIRLGHNKSLDKMRLKGLHL